MACAESMGSGAANTPFGIHFRFHQALPGRVHVQTLGGHLLRVFWRGTTYWSRRRLDRGVRTTVGTGVGDRGFQGLRVCIRDYAGANPQITPYINATVLIPEISNRFRQRAFLHMVCVSTSSI